MTQLQQALDAFFRGFGLPAYVEDEVPAYDYDDEGARFEVKPPYITYQATAPDWKDGAPLYARVWYRDAGNEALNAKVDEIEAAIGEGASLPTESGCVYLFKGNPFVQRQRFQYDQTLKCAYLSFMMLAHTR